MLEDVFKRFKFDLICHFAAQPSHDWAAKEPIVDFDINARVTMFMLENARKYCPEAPFVFSSTNKVYSDRPNTLVLRELDKRYDFAGTNYLNGIDEDFSIDQSKHSIFGASKAAADLMVQEYGRYFNMPTVCFRAGCITGDTHSGAELHGYLQYIVKCAVQDKIYNIFGYKGKQVRDQIAFQDFANAVYEFYLNPKAGAVYNIGGGFTNSVSILETIENQTEATFMPLIVDVRMLYYKPIIVDKHEKEMAQINVKKEEVLNKTRELTKINIELEAEIKKQEEIIKRMDSLKGFE